MPVLKLKENEIYIPVNFVKIIHINNYACLIYATLNNNTQSHKNIWKNEFKMIVLIMVRHKIIHEIDKSSTNIYVGIPNYPSS